MYWYINDLSLDGQFADTNEFRLSLEPLLKLRFRDPLVNERLYCSRQLHERLICANYTFREVISSLSDRNFKRQVMEWITKKGPFIDDERQPNPDDYFEFQREDVTNQGLGEAARRKIAGIDASTFSFIDSRFGFDSTPIMVQHGLVEAPLESIAVENCWTVSNLEQAAQSARPKPQNWRQVIEEAQRRFDGLILADSIMDDLYPNPFSDGIRDRIFELLNVLDCIVRESGLNNQLSEPGQELHRKHFEGEKAWFTSESDTNRQKFKQDLSFCDPKNKSLQIACPWHGKIKIHQFRIHFEWPRPVHQREIKVVYIGPKITRK